MVYQLAVNLRMETTSWEGNDIAIFYINSMYCTNPPNPWILQILGVHCSSSAPWSHRALLEIVPHKHYKMAVLLKAPKLTHGCGQFECLAHAARHPKEIWCYLTSYSEWKKLIFWVRSLKMWGQSRGKYGKMNKNIRKLKVFFKKIK